MTPRRAERLGLGLAALGRPAYITAGRERDVGPERSVGAMRTRARDVLDAAYAGGIRYVDAARSYGRAEEFLADWLKSRPEARDVAIASKWGYRYVGDWSLDSDVHEVKEHTLHAFRTQLRETRALLGDRLDLYQVHSVTEESAGLSDGALQAALADLRDQGVRLGFSTSGPRQAAAIRAAVALNVNGAPLFTSVQSTWNPLETSAAPALAEANDAGIAVVVKEVFANGRIVPGSNDLGPGVQKLTRMAAALGIGVDQLAIAVALHQPWMPRVLSGAVTASQIESHLTGAEITLSTETLSELNGVSEDAEDYWSARSRRAWS